jgi:DNA sulfur modification protein DndB
MKSGYYMFPAIRGIQAGREYYVSMCPMRLLPKIFLFDEAELVPELRAQRQLNKSRLPEMARYISANPDSYIFSAITASIDAVVEFEKNIDKDGSERIGLLKIPMSARFVINDGQHRRAAIEMALKERPEIGDESIAVVFFMDVGLERSQQMFADLNRYAIRPSASLGLLYDHRDQKAALARAFITESTFFKDIVELEKATLSARSRKLFTLSALYQATLSLLSEIEFRSDKLRDATLFTFWHEVAKNLKEWQQVQCGRIGAGEVRADFIHSHGVVLHAIGLVGNSILRKQMDIPKILAKLAKIDWRRSNARLWEGRAMIGGRISKGQQNVTLTANAIKNALGISLTPEEQRIEDAFKRGDNV